MAQRCGNLLRSPKNIKYRVVRRVKAQVSQKNRILRPLCLLLRNNVNHILQNTSSALEMNVVAIDKIKIHYHRY